MSGEQVFPSLERKTQPKRRLPLHFIAELRSLRTSPPIQIALSPPPTPIAVSSTITTTNCNHFEVHNINEIKKQHACKTFWPTSKDEFQQQYALYNYTTSLWAQQQLHLHCVCVWVCVCVCMCVCMRERERERERERNKRERE